MLTTFVLYLILLLVIGAIATRRTQSTDDFLLAGRRLGPLAAALSSAATSMSGWLFMGLPGKVFQFGLSGAWVAIGCICGDYANWKLISTRLRERSGRLGALTLPEFITSCQDDALSKLTRTIAGLGIVFFMTIYLWAQIVATGKALSGPMEVGFDYETAVVVGSLVIIVYTTLGGFVAVVWTDVLQGGLICLALVGLPLYCAAIVLNGGHLDLVLQHAPTANPKGTMGDPWGGTVGLGIFLMLLNNLGVGAGYLGQPQMGARFMALRHERDAKHARWISVTWTVLTSMGVVVIAMCAPVLLANMPHDPEQVVLVTAKEYLPDWLSGILVAALLAAVMSSADSFLIAAVSSIQQDFPAWLRGIARSTLAGRIAVVGLGTLGMILALNTDLTRPEHSVLRIAEYAWAGLAITLAVPIFYCLLVNAPKTGVVLTTITLGIGAMIIWHITGLAADMYEVIPCFLWQGIVCWVAHKIASGQAAPRE